MLKSENPTQAHIYEPMPFRVLTPFIATLFVVAGLWTASLLGFFDLPNGFVYDRMLRASITSTPSASLILIDAERRYAEQGDEVWLALLQNLLDTDARQIVFSFLPRQVSADFYRVAAASGKVVFGRQVADDGPGHPLTLQALPVAADGQAIAYGLVKAAKSRDGVQRSQYATVAINGAVLPSMEWLAARGVSQDFPPSGDYRINFIGGTARIPKISLPQALGGGLVAQLVAGRTVLVGVYGLEPMPSYFTPMAADDAWAADLLFHALALDTLLSGRSIMPFPAWGVLLVIAALACASLFLSQRAFRFSLVLSALLTLATMSASWAMLHGGFLWLPVVELLLAQWLVFILGWYCRAQQENQAMAHVLSNLSFQLQEKVFPVDFYRSDDPWTQLVVLIDQSLSLNRMIFLERVPGRHRLKEIKAHRCDIGDIVERRRDYERTPYSTVINENKPLLQNNGFLQAIDGIEEQQYLAPLMFAGEVLGFWAFTVTPDKIKSPAKFAAMTQAYMAQISEILHYRRTWQERMRRESHRFWKHLGFESTTHSYQVIDQSIALLDRRLSELQEVFDNMDSGCVIYNLFGRLLLANAYIESLARAAGLKIYTMTALDFIVQVCGYTASDARNLLQKTIFDHETASLPVTHFKGNREYILHIRPLTLRSRQPSTEFASEELSVFKTNGILCELLDCTEQKALYALKENVLERFIYQIRNDLSVVLFGLSILGDAKIGEAQKALALANIHDKLDETMTTLDTLKEQTDREIGNASLTALNCYPVDARVVFQKVIEQSEAELASRGISLRVELPDLLSLVFASPIALETVVQTVFSAIVADTYEHGTVWMAVAEKSGWVSCAIRNEGIGISGHNQQTAPEAAEPSSVEALRLHDAVRCVERWGGSLTFAAQIGKGATVQLVLKSFMGATA